MPFRWCGAGIEPRQAMRVGRGWWRGKKDGTSEYGGGDFGKKIGGWGWFCAFGLEKWEKMWFVR